MHPAEKRLRELKELLGKEGDTPYAADLRLTIKQVEKDVKKISSKGYQMVDV